MRRLRSNGLWCMLAILSVGIFNACGAHKPSGSVLSAIKINLTPSAPTSIQLGATLILTATAQNGSGQNIAATFTYFSSDTSILTVAPNGLVCAGHWNSTYSICTPGASGPVQVTASALGESSPPTLIFVHPPIDNITVSGVLLNNVPIQEPCLSQGQTMTVEAQAFSQGTDITQLVGPFTWSANNSAVVKLTPITTTVVFNGYTYTLATNQATATAATPGLTQIFASSTGASSTSFQQPQFVSQGSLSPVFDFFETCPIQSIVLDLNSAGSLQNTFVTSKGGAETVIATLTDVMGNSSLPNTNGGIVLSKIPLTWTSSQPAVVAAAASCQQTCTLATPSPGAAAVTASCSPPTCNLGFPLAPAVLSSASCTQFIQALFPTVNSCQQFIPVPVYASPPTQTAFPQSPVPAAITGVVGGTPSSSTVIATSTGCSSVPQLDCSTSMYSFSTAGGSPGGQIAMPASPNSAMFDLGGDKVFIGSEFGALVANPSNASSNTAVFTPEGSITGKVLAVSTNGLVAIFSDTVHTPNQVYVLNTSTPGQPSTPLNISGATAAAFSPDGLKAFIFGFDSSGNPNLYVYSTQQSLQVLPLPANTAVSSIAFSTNGAFAYVVESALGGVGPAVSVYNTCNNALFTDAITGNSFVPLSAAPIAFKVLPDGIHFAALEPAGNVEYITATVSQVVPATLTEPATSTCPLTVGHDPRFHTLINVGQGNIQPINFFVSPDGTLLYLLAKELNSVLIYDFATGSAAGGIQLAPTPFTPNPTPVTADITVDGGTLLVAGSDSYLHRLTTGVNGVDQLQMQFPSLPNVINPFCTVSTCTLNLVAVKP